jgi:CDP-diacylglycerol---glycerol-3-phosphate 3-phosphatidyltransferase
MHGGFDPRRAPVPVRTWQRLSFRVASRLAGAGASPNLVTTVGLLCSLAVPLVVLPRGFWLLAGAALVALSALADAADGGVAIITGRISGMGTFYDSMADRIGEAAWLLAMWLLGVPAVLVIAAGGLAWLHEYARARAALSGMPGIGAVTVAERPTRVLAVVVGLLIGGAVWNISSRLTAGVLTVAVAVWLVLGILGASRLFGAIRSALR